MPDPPCDVTALPWTRLSEDGRPAPLDAAGSAIVWDDTPALRLLVREADGATAWLPAAPHADAGPGFAHPDLPTDSPDGPDWDFADDDERRLWHRACFLNICDWFTRDAAAQALTATRVRAVATQSATSPDGRVYQRVAVVDRDGKLDVVLLDHPAWPLTLLFRRPPGAGKPRA